MKSEPRQEAKSASPKTAPAKVALAQQPLETPADYWRVYGNRVLLVIIAALAVFLAVRYYREKQVGDARELTLSLENTRTNMGKLQQILLTAAQSGAPDTVQARESIVAQLGDSINAILTTAKDPSLLSRGYLYKGDMKWELANAPDPAGATTRPELKVQNRDGLLDEAREAYSHVLESPYSDDALNLFSARMGIAAIAENQHKWDAAKTQYQAIANSSMPASFKELAHKRLMDLPGLEKTPVLNAAPEMGDLASMLASMAKNQPPTTTMPGTMPTSMPTTTMPSVVVPLTTQPATSQPSTMQSPATQQ